MDNIYILSYIAYCFIILIVTANRFWDDIDFILKNKQFKWLHLIYLTALPIILYSVIVAVIMSLISIVIEVLDKPIKK